MVRRLLLALVVVVSLTACDPAPKSTLHGFVRQLDDGRIPVSAVITVELVGPDGVIASGTVDGGNQLPVPYEFEYDEDDIEPDITYLVGASIEDGEALLYVSQDASAVLGEDLLTEDGMFEVDVVVVPVGG